MTESLPVLFATSELAPWVKTGGLGDVAAALPPALREIGIDLRVLVPAYPALRSAFPDAPVVVDLPAPGGELPPARLRAATAPSGVPLLLLDCPPLYDRPASPYLGPDGHDWSDNWLRFGLLSRVAALLAEPGSPLAWRPRVVHGNDWQTGLMPAYLHYLGNGDAASLMTIHNIAFQGLCDADRLVPLGLPEAAFRFDSVEFHGQLSFLKAGLQHALRLTTVSPTYAREIRDESFGYGLAPLLRYRAEDLTGIVNGIDTDEWNPATDPHLPHRFDARRLAGKAKIKGALQAELGLEVRADLPLFGVVGRLTEQKGVDLLLRLGPALARLPAQLAILGTGEGWIEDGFRFLAAHHPGIIAANVGFSEALAHRIEAGADVFLMPSRFEPCGLNQMYSLRYGTPPVVRATGGLADTVVDAAPAAIAEDQGDGFLFAEPTAEALWEAIVRAIGLWRQPKTWRALQRRGMARDFGWQRSAREYATLYHEMLPRR